ncbi:dTDP-Rha:A-D-GlcNAc-diphosphoryl polyprenol, A-3-L-rhamnosyl transferase WbbL [Nitrincola lacisaponensis]|uniref:dTDP-Rha:A-D-GlcNAc-diphosphoryl polyprenol, A-3-L-rhamnosyl transferase WbbL n=1 Tax=Nitrincola lacisaponensis TaxID=267850 RepID=A0A063Y392_9GAMM|nr:glycosyltransferase family 2 protein [Nitrincola lacisaponensis]KDE39241.1 dTDP-Rha:A-D-GlcNAc-diphosphoryl polyprenol, A-3-L-rhamnosyl transferase WbbL [Nitrincola lacisaponensis]
MKNYPSIDILFVCYNCGKDISVVIKDILSSSYPIDKLKFIVVDNDSHDGSMSFVENIEFPNITTVYTGENLGFGRACNVAIPELSADYLLLVNPDVKIFKNSIENLIKAAQKNQENMIYGGRVLDENGEDSGLSAFKEPTLLGLISWAFFIDIMREYFNVNRFDAYNSSELIDNAAVDSIPGCFFLIKTSLFKSLNGFDERFFMYSEEVDLCKRARECFSAKPMLVVDSNLIHIGGGTTSGLNKLNLLYKHRLVYYKKHWSGLKFNVARYILKLAFLIRRIFYYCLSKLNGKYTDKHTLWKELYDLQKKWNVI